MQADDEVSAKLQDINERFEDAAPLRDVLTAVCAKFGLDAALAALQGSSDAVMDLGDGTPAAAAAGGGGASDPGDGSKEGLSDEDVDDEDDDDDDMYSAAERDGMELMVLSRCASLATLWQCQQADTQSRKLVAHAVLGPEFVCHSCGC